MIQPLTREATTMTTGHVFKIANNFFGIFTLAKPFLLARFIDADTVSDACLGLSLKFAGHFKPASKGTEKIARAMMKRRDTVLLTDN